MSRWIVAVTFLPLLLTFGISSVRGQDNDKSAEWAQGSTWSGTVEQKAGKMIVSVDVTVFVVKRKGKVFEGRYEVSNGSSILEFEGTVDDKGRLEAKTTKVIKTTDEFKKNSGAKNIVGLKLSGMVNGKTFKGRYVWPVAEDITAPPRTGAVELKRKD